MAKKRGFAAAPRRGGRPIPRRSLNAPHIAEFVAEWNQLRTSIITTDYKIAVFFRKDRYRSGYYGAGTSGDDHFKTCVNKNLIGITGAKALRYAKLGGNYTEGVWTTLGGYESINYIHRLDCTGRQRTSLKVKVQKAADKYGQPATHAICRKAAVAMGLVAVEPEVTTAMEQKRNILAQYIYDEMDWDIPQEIINAMPPAMKAEYAEHAAA